MRMILKCVIQTCLVVTMVMSAFSSSASFPGKNYRLTPEQLRFEYLLFDGSGSYMCKHFLEDALSQDWRIDCLNTDGIIQKSYRVHLWLKAYSRQHEPKLSYELLYWISDLSRSPKIEGHSTTVWFHLKDPSALSGMRVSLGVDGDLAGLYMDINKL